MANIDSGLAVTFNRSSGLMNSLDTSTIDLQLDDSSKHTEDSAVLAVTSDPLTNSPSHSSTLSSDAASSSNILIMPTTLEESSPLRETSSDPFKRPRWLRYTDGLCMIITTMVIAAVAVTVALAIHISTGAQQIVPHGGVVSNNGNCSELGKEMLRSSESSTADAAIFTALCLCVAHPHAASIGGGGFSLVHNQRVAENATHLYNFREIGPSSLSNASLISSRFLGKNMSQIDPKDSIAVPGLIKGLFLIHQHHGKMKWNKIVEMAVKLAKDGMSVSSDLATAIDKLSLANLPETLLSLVTNAGGSKLQKGDILKQPALAKTLQKIADSGDAFYSGELSQQFVSQLGSSITAKDLKDYNVTDTYNVDEVTYRDMKIVTGPHPSFGPVLHSVMGTMAFYNQTISTEQDAFLQSHRLAEALKYGFSRIGQNSTRWNITSTQSVGAQTASRINDTQSFPLNHYLEGTQPVQVASRGQQFVSVVGSDGFVISITMSLGFSFGSKQMSMGVVLNDAVLDFNWQGKNTQVDTATLKEPQNNLISGGKQPLSSLVPVIIIPQKSKCGHYVVPGSWPGYISVSATVQYILNKGQGASYTDSVKRYRIHQQLVPYPVQLEASAPEGLMTYLRQLGHEVTSLNGTLGEVDLLEWTSTGVTAVADPRGPNDVGATF